MANCKFTPLGLEITLKRTELGISHGQLATQAGTTPQYLSMILHGKRTGGKYIHKIGQILDINVNKYIA